VNRINSNPETYIQASSGHQGNHKTHVWSHVTEGEKTSSIPREKEEQGGAKRLFPDFKSGDACPKARTVE